MIDILVTYLNERDKKWREDFQYWKDKEVKEKKAYLSNRQAFGVERTREWDAFKYWLRGVEKNCKWVNKVFIIVQNERHIPEWLNLNNPKIRVVYHDEYIPKELLPTFNAMTIGFYVSNIKDLSNNYIKCDDDFYFINEIKEDMFFKDDKPVHPENTVVYKLYGGGCLKGSDNVFYHILNNNLIFETRFMKNRVKYGFYHLPSARKKDFEKEIISKYSDEIKKHFSYSKFRNKTNLCDYMFDDLLKICKKTYNGDPYKNSAYCTLKSSVDFDKYMDRDIVCFNDTEQLDDYDKTKERFIEFLEKKFPKKSSFEK